MQLNGATLLLKKGDSNSEGVTHPVGQKYGNRFGLYDTIGNVWEWCWDWKAPHNMNLSSPKDPKGPNTKKEINDYLAKFKAKKLSQELIEEKQYLGLIKKYQGGRILKGCAYDTGLGYFMFQTSAFRVGLNPEKTDKAVGFRVVRGID